MAVQSLFVYFQNNFNLILSNQNTAKNAEDLQQKVTSMNFTLNNLMNEIAKLKQVKKYFNFLS